MKIELVDNHSNTALIAVVWFVVSLLWGWSLDIFERDLATICLILGSFNLLPFLLVKQYIYGMHLRLGLNNETLYFPAKNKTIQEIPIKYVRGITLGKTESGERTADHPFEGYFIEVIYVEIENFSSKMYQNLLPPLWGWFTDNGIAINYIDREEALVIVSRMNELRERYI